MTSTYAEYQKKADAAFERYSRIFANDWLGPGRFVAREDEEVISDAEQAVYYATSQDAQDTHPGIQYWTNILEYASMNEDDLEIPDMLRSEVIRYIDALVNRLLDSLNKLAEEKNLPDEITGVTIELFYGFIVEMVFLDSLPTLHQKLLAIYERGGFPCGWRGDYPKGVVLVFPGV